MGGDGLLLVKPVPRLRDRGSSAGGKQKARRSVVQGTEPGRLERWKYPPGCSMDAHKVSAVAPSRLWVGTKAWLPGGLEKEEEEASPWVLGGFGAQAPPRSLLCHTRWTPAPGRP